LSDRLKATYGVDALRNAAVACTSFYILAAILVLLAVKSLRSSWVDDTAQ
jgi:cellobiose-specific phosphotransferase system component IIC